ncbi:MAG: DUF2147 domain-containing protein [Saprospiraceae bacterium]|nr:DUF2147 domain-containing protein [Saprospiraceae bacterium]
MATSRLPASRKISFFKKDGKEWTGDSILDPANGRTYRCTIWLEDTDTLKLSGYWGIFWRTQTWKRVG